MKQEMAYILYGASLVVEVLMFVIQFENCFTCLIMSYLRSIDLEKNMDEFQERISVVILGICRYRFEI